MRSYICVLLLLGPALVSAETINQCRGTHGRVMFSNKPCTGGEKMTTVEVRPNVVDSSGSRQTRSYRYRKTWFRTASSAATSSTSTPKKADKVNTTTCRNAQRDYAFESHYEFADSRKHRRSEAMRAKRGEVFAACGYRP